MNRKMIFYMVGQIVKLEAALLTIPLVVSLCYGEFWTAASFGITIAVSLFIGFLFTLTCKTEKKDIYAKEGFIITAFVWIIMSAIGALPFVIDGAIPNFIDAFFETVSGFTTTGASILSGDMIEGMNYGLLFWRSFTHWIGGMGVLVLIVAILPTVSGRTIHVLRAEMPGPTMGKLVPKLKDTAKILYIMYIALTLLETVFLLFGGMPLFDSVIHSLGTAGTGGFGIRADSIAGYSAYCQWVITVFMFLFGINFNMYYLLIMKRFKSVFSSEELWTYIGTVAVSVVLITVNVRNTFSSMSLSNTVRASAFQVSSFLTTTGYSTVDYNNWPVLSKTVLLLLMFMGGCAGSTAGGLKVSRVVLLVKCIRRELRHMIHPRSVNVIRFEGKKVENTTLVSVSTYFAVYILILGVLFLILSFDPAKYSLEANFSSSVSIFNNIGPAYAEASAGFGGYSMFSKIAMSTAMLLGRLEIYPLLLTFSLATWKDR